MSRIKRDTSYSSLPNRDDVEICDCIQDNNEISPISDLSQSASYIGTADAIDKPIVFVKSHNDRCRRTSCHNPMQRRVLQKNGTSHLVRTNVPLRYSRYLRDLGNTMVNSRWRWITLALVMSFFVLWILFGWFWLLIATAHGDLETEPRNDSCSIGVQSFAGFLLMSIETQTTIGYGSRYPTENCPEGVFMLCLQMILGIGIEGAILGMVYVKMTRPTMRDSRRLFSKNAVVCQRDGDLCLMFRVCDKKRSHIVGTQIKAYLMETRYTSQGEIVPSYQTPLELEPPGLLLWPLILVHRIAPESPLYDISAKDLLTKKFEIVVIMVGSSDSTGQMTQSRTSYLATEILWGHRFKPCLVYDYFRKSYVIQKELFNQTDVVDTPLCSANRLRQVLNDLDEFTNHTPPNSPADDSPTLSPLNIKTIDFGSLTETVV